jgi:hypothetical protein
LKAAKFLEDAVAVEELRQRTSLGQTKKSAKKIAGYSWGEKRT